MLIMLIQCNTDQKSVNINFDRASVVSGCQGGVHTKMQEKQIWLGLSHLSEHRFNHNFNNSINFYAHAAWTLSQQFTIFSISATIIVLEHPP